MTRKRHKRREIDEATRRAVVARVLAGEVAAHVARDIEIDATTLRRWLMNPRLGGDPAYDGDAARAARGWNSTRSNRGYTSHSLETKRAVVARVLAGETTQRAISKETGIAESTLSSWVTNPAIAGDLAAPPTNGQLSLPTEPITRAGGVPRPSNSRAIANAPRSRKTSLNFCPQCGANLQSFRSLNFCPQCGADLKGNTG